ncbi:MAG: hypoxanthine phosphoribosyltransferase [Chloroflexota bacterium]
MSVRLTVCVSRTEIEEAVRQLAAQLTRDFRGKRPVLVGVLKGAFVFLADLVRELDFPVDVDFIRVASYGNGTETSGRVRLVQPLRIPIRGRDVVLVEDIVDTGLTSNYLLDYLRRKRPASVRLCTLTDKPSRRQVPVHIDYLGFTVPDRFLVGYGLDASEEFRNLPEICFLEEK